MDAIEGVGSAAFFAARSFLLAIASGELINAVFCSGVNILDGDGLLDDICIEGDGLLDDTGIDGIDCLDGGDISTFLAALSFLLATASGEFINAVFCSGVNILDGDGLLDVAGLFCIGCVFGGIEGNGILGGSETVLITGKGIFFSDCSVFNILGNGILL